MRLFWFTILWALSILSIEAQEDKPKNWTLSGYIKDLVTVNFADDSTLIDNLIHNRLNFDWYPNEQWHFQLEVRNRLFYGDLVKAIPNYGEFVDRNNDYFDLSFYGPKNKSWLFHTMIDRAYVEWYNEKWEVRAGRQRINWGVNLVWNPNDIFNSYSFFDFDYEERPGSDALRIRKYLGFASSIEFAVTANNDFDEMVIAGMYKFNKKGYDFQVFTGKARQDLTAGVGWAGNLGDAGFKGEVSYFKPYTDKDEFSNALLASISVDYSFESSLYLHGSYLYNSDGSDTLVTAIPIFDITQRLTARNLSPLTHSILVQTSYNFHPLVTGGLATIYYPSTQAIFINPTATYSIKPNLDLDVIGQFFFDDYTGKFKAQAKLLYARLKWSF
ncbi:hypothetical protein OO013_16410 [Mangrovivirga sp. M17]|uniref:Alginate export domain-containing protein n=1 Tax=Mangrovivirga halotolerans TaxID=2993936 RepID=A0ABT3RVS6_9BACT|nr:hypothetical protein [Mangrovivirga halotolerans]MCX2745464.1 hypothetical protein [Mangrovivirga halotolerans]